MKRLILGLLFVISFSTAFSQTIFVSSAAGGNWNAGTTWDQTTCPSGCTAGLDYPGPGDIAVIAVTAGSSVNFPTGSNYFCGELYIVNDVAGSLKTSGFGSANLTIDGLISGTLPDLSATPAEPTVDVFQSSISRLTIIFTGASLDVITSWGHASPFYKIAFNPGSGMTQRVNSHSIRMSSTVQSGTVQINSSQNVRDYSGSAQFVVNASSELRVLGTINGDGTTSSRFTTVTVSGTLTTETAGYVNATNFSLGAAATLNLGFNGPDQTQGWWYQSTFPTNPSISNTSTVNYNASAAQNIYATTYGNLSLNSMTSVTKSLVGTGLIIQGNLVVGNNVSFAPATQVDFNGSGAQSISGGGTLSFLGGVEVNKATGTLNISKNLSSTGLTITAGTLDLGNVTTTITGGNFINSGTLTSGSAGTLAVSGTSTFSGSGSLNLNNVSVSGSASFTNSALSVTGNISNTGSIAFASTSSITFSGGLNQIISGNAFSIGNMVVNKTSSTLSNDGNVELLGVLTLTNGTFDADGSGSGIFTLNSDANGDASIGAMGGGSITGEVTVERYFSNSSNRWRNIGFPVTGVTFAELGSSITLSSGSLGTYTESTLGNVDQGWNIISSGTLNSRLGHSAYMYDIAPITISVRGPLLQNVPSTSGSPYNYQVTYTDDPAQPATEDGWNFIPNPYAAPINWNAVSGWTKTRVNAAAAVWDAQNGVYLYSNVSWDGVLAHGQSFWVQTNGASPSLTSTESVKVTNSDASFYRVRSTETSDSRLFITLGDRKNSDKALIQFKGDAKEEFDAQYDATKLKNLIFNLSSFSPGGLDLAANALPKSFCTSKVQLNISNITPGKYYLKFDGITSFSDVESITLTDRYTNTSKVLTEGESYNFHVTEELESSGAGRFEVRFSFKNTSLKSPEITVDGKKLVSNFNAGNQWYLNGEPIEGATGSSIMANRVGTYALEVTENGCSAFSAPVEISRGHSRAFPNPAKDDLTVDLSGLTEGIDETGFIDIYSLSGEIVKREVFSSSEKDKNMIVNSIKPGVYVLKIIVRETVIVEERIIIK